MARKLLIRDVTLRDSQESLFGAKMTQREIDALMPSYKKAGFYSVDIWGDTIPGSIMRYWNENPWLRIEKIKEAIGSNTILSAFARGRNLLGHAPFPDKIIKDFYEVLTAEGIKAVRIYDPLNDIENLKSSITYIKRFGGLADVAICYSTDTHRSILQRIEADIHKEHLGKPVYTKEYFIRLAKAAEKEGADFVTLYDPLGIARPERVKEIISAWKENLSVKVGFHTHCTEGYGLASALAAIVAGADMIDTSVWNLSGGDAAPAVEIINNLCGRMGIETDLDMESVSTINAGLRHIGHEIEAQDAERKAPKEFDPVAATPGEIEHFFEDAITAAEDGREEDLLLFCNTIESYFNFPLPKRNPEEEPIPIVMMRDAKEKLSKLNKQPLLESVIKFIPEVRAKAGMPPMVPPMEMIIVTQAIKCAVNEKVGRQPFNTPTIPYTMLVKGEYGETPLPIKPEFREEITGSKEEVKFDEASFPLRKLPPEKQPSKNPMIALRDQVLIELYPVLAQSVVDNDIESNP
jgi:oxaloacetate decarboxylase alpha subunit/pyruvate carboxylase subunit B